MAKQGKHENSLKNLEKGKPFDADSARKAQQISTQKKKEKKLLKDVAIELLISKMPNGETFQEFALKELKKRVEKGEVSTKDLIAIIEFIRDTSGQKPIDKQEINVNEVPIIKDDI